MSLETGAIFGLSLYILVMLAIGWLSGRGKAHSHYVIGGRDVGVIATAASIGAGWRDISYISFWVSFAYVNGWAISLNLVGTLVSMLIISRLVPRFFDQIHEKNYVSAGELIRDEIGPLTQKTYAGFVLFVAVIFSAAQLFVLGNIASHIFDVTASLTIPAISLLVGFYLWRGGYGSVILTDLIQYGVILSLILAPFFIPARAVDMTDFSSFGNLGLWETAALLVLPFFWNAPAADLWQRIFSARSPSVLKQGLPLGALALALLTVSLVYIGIALRGHIPQADAQNLYLDIFTADVLPAPVLSALVVVMFAMGMSTLDTNVYVFSSSFLKDFMGEKGRKIYISHSRKLTLVFLLVLTGIALSYQDLISVLMGIISALTLAAPVFWLILLRCAPKGPLSDKVLSAVMVVTLGLFLYMHFNDFFGTSFIRSLIPVGFGLALSFGWAAFYAFFKSRRAL